MPDQADGIPGCTPQQTSAPTTAPTLTRATGAWLPGDPPGNRQFANIGVFHPEQGGAIDVTFAYETWGSLNQARDNAVLVLHALTGDSHVIGQAGPGHPTPGWWEGIIGPGKPVDTNTSFVVAPNVLGGCQGTTGPASLAPDGRPWGGHFPYITIRDQVRAEIALADLLGIDRWALIIGGSMGGMRVLEWAATAPERAAKIAAIATTARSSADSIAWSHVQLSAIMMDPHFHNGRYYDQPDGLGPTIGLGLARQIAHATYRSSEELDSRFGQDLQDDAGATLGGRYAVQSYLEYHAEKLSRRFDANSYVTLTRATMSHDVGRDRRGLNAALNRVKADALVVAVDTDRLFPPVESQIAAHGMPTTSIFKIIHSNHGHDGFLIETSAISQLITQFLN